MNVRQAGSLPLLAVYVLLLGAAPGAWAAGSTFEQTFTVSGPVDLAAQTHSGNISVRTGGPGSVLVRGTIRVRDRYTSDADRIIQELKANLPLEQAGNSIHVRNIGEELRRRVSISYEITTPAETSADLQTGSGNVGVEGVRGPVEAHSGSGNVAVSGISDTASANTGSGNIALNSIGGSGRARTGSGSIIARGIGGDFSGSTGSGNVVVEQTAAGNVEMNSGSGSLEARGVKGSLNASTGSGNIVAEGAVASDWRLRTSSGSVRIDLPSEAAFTVEARSSSGSVEVNHPLTLQGRIGRREVRGTVRGGGSLLAVSTSSGSIQID
jgi:DUF4097 and DUF4098 domain-containing protein YvlB